MTEKQRNDWLNEFLYLTGYGHSDVLSLSYSTQTVLTMNGGKYQFINGEVIHIAGPDWDPTERL